MNITLILLNLSADNLFFFQDLYEVRMLDTLNELNQEINVELKKFKQLQHVSNLVHDTLY